MQAPARSGSDYCNYKKTHSIVLLAVCYSHYVFTLVDIGQAGRQSDGGVYKNSNLGYAIDHNTLNIPPPAPVNNSNKVYPYVFVSDDAFPLKPFPLSYSQAYLHLQAWCPYRYVAYRNPDIVVRRHI